MLPHEYFTKTVLENNAAWPGHFGFEKPYYATKAKRDTKHVNTCALRILQSERLKLFAKMFHNI